MIQIKQYHTNKQKLLVEKHFFNFLKKECCIFFFCIIFFCNPECQQIQFTFSVKRILHLPNIELLFMYLFIYYNQQAKQVIQLTEK